MTTEPLNTLDSEDLLDRKDRLVEEVGRLVEQAGLAPDYPWNLMVAAKTAGLEAEGYIALLERLLEIESIKYTLAARMIREMQAEGDTP